MNDDDSPTAEDEQLLAQLRGAMPRIDPVPERVVSAAKGSFTWRTIDAELAELAYDSAVDDDVVTGVRSVGSGSRFLSFEAPAVTLDVCVEVAGERRRLVGQIAPPQRASLEVAAGGRTTSVDADEVGRFVVDDVAAGPVSLRGVLDDGGRFETEWLTM